MSRPDRIVVSLGNGGRGGSFPGVSPDTPRPQPPQPPFDPVLVSPSPTVLFDSKLSAMQDGSSAPVVNGSGIATAKDTRGTALWAQATSGLRFTYNTGTMFGSRPACTGTSAADSALGGNVGVTGNTDWTIYGVGRVTPGVAYPPPTDVPLFTLGADPSGFIVGANAGQGWIVSGIGANGGSGFTSSATSTPHDKGDQDRFAHVFVVDYRASDSRVRLFVDGRLVIQNTSARSLTAVSGIGELNPFSLKGNSDIAAYFVRPGVDSDSVRAQHETYLALNCACFGLIDLGDSLSFGTDPDNPGIAGPGQNDVLTFLRPQIALGGSGWNYGVPGQTTAQIGARVGNVTNLGDLLSVSLSVPTGIPWCVTIGGGTNDFISAGLSPAQAKANTAATIAAIRAAQPKWKVLLWEMIPCGANGIPGTFEANRLAYNALLPGMADGVIPSSFTNPLDTNEYASDATHLKAGSVGHGYSRRANDALPYVKSVLGIP